MQANEIQTSVADVEHIFVSVKTTSSHLLVSGVYIPPSQPSTVYAHYCEAVDEVISITSISSIIIAGDFNLPEINWSTSDSSAHSRSSRYLIDLMTTFSLDQKNYVLNQRGVLLDLIFCSLEPVIVGRALDPILPTESSHPPISCELPITSPKLKILNETYNYRRSNHMEIFRRMHSYLGTVWFDIQDTVTFFNDLLKGIHNIVIDNTPRKLIGRSSFPCWFSPQLRSLVVQKKVLHRQFKICPSPSAYDAFRHMRSLCKELSSQCYAGYVTRVNESIPVNIKSFWNFVNSHKGNRCVPESFRLGDRTASTPNDVCDLFADHFSSVFNTSNKPPPITKCHSEAILSSCVLEVEDVERKLSSLDPNKGVGPDEIPPAVLKYCSSMLAPQLTVIFNKLLVLGIYPDVLKSSFIIPIHKSSSVADVRNYRPIAIQSAIGKVFESLVLDYISFPFKSMLAQEQHGFARGRSTVTNLVIYKSFITSSFTSGLQVDSAYIDFSKAFDVVNHRHLLYKLEAHGITGSLLIWFESYLFGRTLRVKFNGGISHTFTATSGVPQGSHLGPFLFTLFINDIVKIIDVNCLLFADDIKLFCSISTPDDCARLQGSLTRIGEWCIDNDMKINVSKCAIITFHRISSPVEFNYSLCGKSLVRVSNIKDLGVLFSANLSPEFHIEYITKRANKMLGFLIRMSRCGLSVIALKTIYVSLIRSVLEYCCVVWSPFQIGHIDRLQNIQDRFVRIVALKLRLDLNTVPLGTVECMMGLSPLSVRRDMHDLLFLKKLISGALDCPELLRLVDIRVPSRTRSLHLFSHHTCSRNYEYHSIVPRLHRLGNSISAEHDFFFDSELALKRLVLLSSTLV